MESERVGIDGYRQVTFGFERDTIEIVVTLDELNRAVDGHLTLGESSQVEGWLIRPTRQANIWVNVHSLNYIIVEAAQEGNDWVL